MVDPTFDWFAGQLDVATWESQTVGARSVFTNCPVHGGSDSLHITETGTGALVHCFACQAGKTAVIAALDGVAEDEDEDDDATALTVAPRSPAPRAEKPLDWLAGYVGVPREFLDHVPVAEHGDRVAFVFGDGMPVKLRAMAGGKKAARAWSPSGMPTPPLWPMPPAPGDAERDWNGNVTTETPPALPEVIIVTEGETDCLAWWASIAAAGLEGMIGAFAITKGAGTPPDREVFELLKERGVHTVLLAFDADEAGGHGIEAWLAVAAKARLRARPIRPDALDPLRGEKDARDVYRRLGDLDIHETPPAWKAMSEWLTQAPSALDWVIQNVAARGVVLMLAGPMKGGKTTWLADALRHAALGEKFMGAWETAPDLPILYMTEEGQVTANLVMGDLGIDIISKRDHYNWTLTDAISAAADWLDEHPGGLIVFDTYDKWAGIEDENATIENVRAIEAMSVLAHAGAALLIVHHSRKGGGEYGEGIRGAGAILGAVDGAIELKYVGKNSDRRKIEYHGRVTDNLSVLVDYDRAAKEYTLVDSSSEYHEELSGYVEGVPTKREDPNGVSRQDLEKRWDIANGRNRIEQLRKAQLLERSADMVKVGRGKEWRYWRSGAITLDPSQQDRGTDD